MYDIEKEKSEFKDLLYQYVPNMLGEIDIIMRRYADDLTRAYSAGAKEKWDELALDAANQERKRIKELYGHYTHEGRRLDQEI